VPLSARILTAHLPFPSTTLFRSQFEIDRPEILRRGQTLQVILALSDQTQALLLPKGGFYNKTGGNWIFKLSPDGKRAYKTEITIDRKSTRLNSSHVKTSYAVFCL